MKVKNLKIQVVLSFVLYYIYGISGPSLLIESTDSIFHVTNVPALSSAKPSAHCIALATYTFQCYRILRAIGEATITLRRLIIISNIV